MADELIVARTIRDVSLWGIGRELGYPLLHDDGTESEMFDIEFSHTAPRAAMEVTSIVDGQVIATHDAAQKTVERSLTRLAEESGLNVDWTFQIYAGTSLKSLAGLMTEIIQSGDAPTGRDIAPGLIRVDTEPSDSPQVSIATWANSSMVGGLQGFSRELMTAIQSNRAKLGKAEGYERHLAIDVLGMRASDPGLTPCPRLPDEIDFIWVTRRAYSLRRGSPVIWVSDGTEPWRANGEPQEAM